MVKKSPLSPTLLPIYMKRQINIMEHDIYTSCFTGNIHHSPIDLSMTRSTETSAGETPLMREA